MTLKDFRVLLITHVAGAERFDYERANRDSLDERMQTKLPRHELVLIVIYMFCACGFCGL